jgi:hypothetical protein
MRQVLFLQSGLGDWFARLIAGCKPRAKAYPMVEEPPPVEVEHPHRGDRATVDKRFAALKCRAAQ